MKLKNLFLKSRISKFSVYEEETYIPISTAVELQAIDSTNITMGKKYYLTNNIFLVNIPAGVLNRYK